MVWLAHVAVSAVLLLACGADPSDPSTDESQIGADDSGSVPITAADIDAIHGVAVLSEFQRDLVADGVLTLEDYQAAYVALVKCMADAGWILSRELPPTMSRGHSFHAFHPIGDEKAREASRACRETYVTAINWWWSQTHRFSEQELEAARVTLGACLRDHGALDFPEHPSSADINAYLASPSHRARPEGFRDCQIRIELEHGIPDFGG